MAGRRCAGALDKPAAHQVVFAEREGPNVTELGDRMLVAVIVIYAGLSIVSPYLSTVQCSSPFPKLNRRLSRCKVIKLQRGPGQQPGGGVWRKSVLLLLVL